MRRYALLFTVCAVTALGACNIDNQGRTPPAGEIYYPITAVLAPADPGEASPFLYVANSNFDLRYNAGTLQSFDLAAIADAIPDDCEDCVVDSLEDILVSEVRIGSQASSVALTPTGDRLFVGIRADSNVTTVNVNPKKGTLTCGGSGDFARCAGKYETVDESLVLKRDVRFQGDAVAMHAGAARDLGIDEDGNYLLVAHRNGRASLLFDRLEAPEADKPADDDRMPVVVDVISGLPTYLYGMRVDTTTGTAWVTNARDRVFTGIGVALAGDADRVATDTRLYQAGYAVLSGVNDGTDTRDVLFDTLADGSRKAYILSRTPEAILVADVDDAQDGQLKITRAIETGFGPSKFELLKITARGEERTLIVVSCFNSRDLEFVDPVLGRVVAVLRGAVGPFSFTIDTARERIYVADFRASVVRVASYKSLIKCLDEGVDGEGCDPVMLGTVGTANVQGDLL